MNGIVITSLEGGILLYERSYVPNYGLGSQEINALQFSSSLYTVYRISQGEQNESSGLHWILKVRFENRCCWCVIFRRVMQGSFF